MPILQNSPLEERYNPSQWAALFERALPALDYVFDKNQALYEDTVPNWTLGSGTALALQISHRISDDIDIFISGVPLRKFTPHQNPRSAEISKNFQWSGNYLKFQLANGEIDFLQNDFQTTNGFTIENFKGREVALESAGEVIAKKVRFRSASFKDRDIFDLVAVSKYDPKITETLALYVGDKLDLLGHLIDQRTATRKLLTTATIKALPAYAHLLETGPKDALEIILQAQELHKVVTFIFETNWIGPALKKHSLCFDWDGISDQVFEERAALVLKHRGFAKPQLVSLFAQRYPSEHTDWKAGKIIKPIGRRAAEIGD